MLTNTDSDDEDNPITVNDPAMSEILAQLENRSFQGLEGLNAFDFEGEEEKAPEKAGAMVVRIDPEERDRKGSVFLPEKRPGDRVLYGSLQHYFPFMKFLFTLYERIRYVDHLIRKSIEEKMSSGGRATVQQFAQRTLS